MDYFEQIGDKYFLETNAMGLIEVSIKEEVIEEEEWIIWMKEFW